MKLKEWLATTPYLTATSQWLPDPSQIVTDFTFARAPDDTPFQQVLYDDTYFLPGDVGALLVALLLAGAVWLTVRLLRRRGHPLVEAGASDRRETPVTDARSVRWCDSYDVVGRPSSPATAA